MKKSQVNAPTFVGSFLEISHPFERTESLEFSNANTDMVSSRVVYVSAKSTDNTSSDHHNVSTIGKLPQRYVSRFCLLIDKCAPT
jgi:hypothetical protein